MIGISSSCEGALGRSRKNDGSRIENNILKYVNHCEIMWGTSLFMSMLWMHVPYYSLCFLQEDSDGTGEEELKGIHRFEDGIVSPQIVN